MLFLAAAYRHPQSEGVDQNRATPCRMFILLSLFAERNSFSR